MIALGIIPDGNRRWGIEHGLQPWQGHKHGAECLKNILRRLYERNDVYAIVIYMFSHNNLKRTKREVYELMKIFCAYFRELLKDIMSNGAKATIEFIGDYDDFPKRLNQLFERIRKMSQGCTKKVYFIVNHIPNIDMIPNTQLDLVIRTGNQNRLSGFLPHNIAESEIIFRKEMWPDYTVRKLDNDIKKFYATDRRFGT